MVLLLGVTAAFETPTRQSFLSQLVTRDDIPSAVGLNGAVMTGGRVMGASIAGILIAVLGASVCLYVNAVSYVAVIVALVMIRAHDLQPATVVPRARGQVRDGLRYAMRTPEVRFPLVAMAVVGTISLNQQVLVPLLARVTFGAGPGLFAAFSAAGALGALTGSLTAARVTTSTVSNIGRAACGFGVVYSLTAFAPWVWLALVGLAGAFFNASLYIAWTTRASSRRAPIPIADGSWRCTPSCSSARHRSAACSSVRWRKPRIHASRSCSVAWRRSARVSSHSRVRDATRTSRMNRWASPDARYSPKLRHSEAIRRRGDAISGWDWSAADPVERHRALRGDGLLLGVRQAFERLGELLGDARELRIRMRVVRRPDDAVGTHER